MPRTVFLDPGVNLENIEGILQGILDQERKRSSGLRRIFTVAFDRLF